MVDRTLCPADPASSTLSWSGLKVKKLSMSRFTTSDDSGIVEWVKGRRQSQYFKGSAFSMAGLTTGTDMGQENLPDYIQYLVDPGSYAHQVAEVQLLQTHISFIALAGEYAYKWKKPVNLGFLDFSTLEKRKYFCEQELLLNRRLCPEVYLAVVYLSRQGDSFGLNEEGEIIEYGVQMTRLPADRMMSTMMGRGQLCRGDIDRIIARLVPFYARAERFGADKRFGSASAVAENVLENLDKIQPFIDNDILVRGQFERIGDFSKRFLGRQELFARRLHGGRVRDCHGDLHSGNICLAEEVCIFDCIEFSERLRCGDVAADVAFLAMDLDLHGEAQLSGYFIEQFILHSGDSGILDMLDFYKCYRACVRGKINLLTAIDPGLDTAESQRCRVQARRCFSMAESYVPIS